MVLLTRIMKRMDRPTTVGYFTGFLIPSNFNTDVEIHSQPLSYTLKKAITEMESDFKSKYLHDSRHAINHFFFAIFICTHHQNKF